MKRKVNLLERLYERDKSTGAFIIRVSIKNYNDIFNELDPAPFRRRDLDQDLVAYLDECSHDIPLKNKILLEFVSEMDIRDDTKEERIIKGFRNYYKFLILNVQREIASTYKKSLSYIVTSIVLLILSNYSGMLVENLFLLKLIREGLNIGGWVFLWEAIALLVFKNRESRVEGRRYKRYLEVPISFKYK